MLDSKQWRRQIPEEITKLATLTGQDRKALAEKMAREKQAADIEIKTFQMSGEASAQPKSGYRIIKRQVW